MEMNRKYARERLESLVNNEDVQSMLLRSDIEAMKCAISALSENRGWTPVSKGLPTKDGKYLLWGKKCEVEENDHCFIGEYDFLCRRFGYWEGYKVIAWQPLPEGYEE